MDTLSAILSCLYLMLVISALGSVLFDNRDPHRTIAWLLVIVGVPFGGLILYYFFGQNLRREYKARHKKALDEFSLWLQKHDDIKQRLIDIDNNDFPQRYESLRTFQQNTCQALTFKGKNTIFFNNAADFIESLIKDIQAAKSHVHLEFFIFEDDCVGQQVADALSQAAKRGVQTRLIYDDVGCWKVPRVFFKNMEDNGVKVEAYSKVHFRWVTHRVNYRNHRKICVIDGNTAYLGGMNIAKRYVYGEREGRNWKDLMMRMEGTAVNGAQSIFLYDWLVCSGEWMADISLFSPLKENEIAETKNENAFIQVVTTEPFGSCHNILMGYNHLIENARQRILIQTPYFMPSASLLAALQTAARRGVDVEVMVPDNLDSFWMTHANHSYYYDVLSAGVNIFTYMPGMLHSKMLLIDDDFVSVGSVNIDYRSLEETFEDSAFIYDKKINEQLANMFMQEKINCKQIDYAKWKKRSFIHRTAEALMRIFTPLL